MLNDTTEIQLVNVRDARDKEIHLFDKLHGRKKRERGID